MRHLFKLFAILTFAALIITACSDDEENPTDGGDNEYKADASDFAGFMDWEHAASNQGADPAFGEAHGLNDENTIRDVYFKDAQDRVDGEYPKGTIIVKYSHNPENEDFQEYTAMVKRGGDFNTDGNGWEWFMLAGDGQIAKNEDGDPVRGANLMNGMCQGCHNGAANKDFVFSKD